MKLSLKFKTKILSSLNLNTENISYNQSYLENINVRLMLRLYLTVYDNQERNLTLVKMNFQVYNSNFKPALLSRLFDLFKNYISRDFDNTKILLYKLFVWYLVIKPACVNAA